jgi:hypothetical protein
MNLKLSSSWMAASKAGSRFVVDDDLVTAALARPHLLLTPVR